MTPDTPPDAANGQHLDEEATSAALDGEASAGDLAHVQGCARCRASLDRLRAARAAVAAPVAVDAEARETAIAAALAAFRPAPADSPLPAATPFTPPPGRRPVAARRRAIAPWLGIAAILLLVVLATPLLRSDVRSEESTAADSEESADTGAGAEGQDGDGAGDATTAPAPPVDIGDLGPLDREADLRPVIDAALGQIEDEDALTGEERPETAAEADVATTMSPSDGSSGEAEPAPTPADEDARRLSGTCERAVRAALPDAGALLLVGTATVEEVPTLVYGFAAPTERPTVLAALVRSDGCELVTFQSYARG